MAEGGNGDVDGILATVFIPSWDTAVEEMALEVLENCPSTVDHMVYIQQIKDAAIANVTYFQFYNFHTPTYSI